MPYINQTNREQLDPVIDQIVEVLAELNHGAVNNTQGNINYIITRLLHLVYGADGNYQNINNAIGILQCAQLEYYRKVAGPYEDRKIEQNGDISVRRWNIRLDDKK